jgi:hypothetical protein
MGPVRKVWGVRAGSIAASVAGFVTVSAASAQITVTGQLREITGSSTSTDPGGTFESGPLSTSAPEGDFGPWFGMLSVPGFISGTQIQNGGFNGFDTITLDGYSMNLGGGNGPGTSADSVTASTFSFTFDVPAQSDYQLTARFGCAGPGGPPNTTNEWSVVCSLVGPGGDVFRFQTGPENGFGFQIEGQTGSLAPGSYTLTVVGTGHVAFLAPIDSQGNGAGGGAGGAQPNLILEVIAAPGGCPADFNGDGFVNPDDLSDFITCFFLEVQFPGTCPDADFNDDAFVNPDDLSDFITTFFLGC